MKEQVKTVSTYNKRVVNANRSLNDEFTSLGGLIAVLNSIGDEKLLKIFDGEQCMIEVIRAAHQKPVYEFIKKHCRITKKGKYVKYYFLQCVNKHAATLLELIKY